MDGARLVAVVVAVIIITVIVAVIVAVLVIVIVVVAAVSHLRGGGAGDIRRSRDGGGRALAVPVITTRQMSINDGVEK